MTIYDINEKIVIDTENNYSYSTYKSIIDNEYNNSYLIYKLKDSFKTIFDNENKYLKYDMNRIIGKLSKNPRAIRIIKNNIDKVNWEFLSSNLNAIDILQKKEYWNKISWRSLSENPNAIRILEKNIRRIHWDVLSRNPNAIPILEKNVKILYDDCWFYLSLNPNAITILERNYDNINWNTISNNPNALSIFEKNIDKLKWHDVAKHPNAISFIEKNMDKLNKESCHALMQNPNAIYIFDPYMNMAQFCKYAISLAKNPNAIHIIEKYIGKIKYNSSFWSSLSENPNAIHILEKYINYIDWFGLCQNPNAIKLLEKNIDKLLDKKIIRIRFDQYWNKLSKKTNNLFDFVEKNYDKLSEYYHREGEAFPIIELMDDPSIFELDYDYLKKRMDIIREELMMKVYHPKRLQYYIDLGYTIEDIIQ